PCITHLSRFYLTRRRFHFFCSFFLFIDPPPTQIYTLSLHDALPISIFVQPPPSQQTGRREDLPRHSGRDLLRRPRRVPDADLVEDRKSTRLNSSHEWISYAVFCLKKKKNKTHNVIQQTLSQIQTCLI